MVKSKNGTGFLIAIIERGAFRPFLENIEYLNKKKCDETTNWLANDRKETHFEQCLFAMLLQLNCKQAPSSHEYAANRYPEKNHNSSTKWGSDQWGTWTKQTDDENINWDEESDRYFNEYSKPFDFIVEYWKNNCERRQNTSFKSKKVNSMYSLK